MIASTNTTPGSAFAAFATSAAAPTSDWTRMYAATVIGLYYTRTPAPLANVPIGLNILFSLECSNGTRCARFR